MRTHTSKGCEQSQNATVSVCVGRDFRLYLRTNDQLFTDDFTAVIVNENGEEQNYLVNRLNFFSGHVIGTLVSSWFRVRGQHDDHYTTETDERRDTGDT